MSQPSVFLPQLRPQPLLETEGSDLILGTMSLPSSHITEQGSSGDRKGAWEAHPGDCDLRKDLELSHLCGLEVGDGAWV